MNDAALQILGHAVPWRTLSDLLADKHASHGDTAFAEIAGTPVTYRELDLVSQVVAANLLVSSLMKGDRVATFMFNAPEQLYTWFGCARAGLVWVPLNAGLVGEDLAYTLRNSGARVLVADEECGARFAAIHDTLPSIRLVVTDETPAMPGSEAFAALRARRRHFGPAGHARRRRRRDPLHRRHHRPAQGRGALAVLLHPGRPSLR